MKDILTKPMFTGIVEEVGIVQLVDRLPQSARIEIEAKKTLENSKIGDSIAVNGACLTVTNLTVDRFNADISAETLRLTNLGNLKVGSLVNLERSVRLVDRVNGHLVQGHVDQIGECVNISDENGSWIFTFKYEKPDTGTVIHKGSIAINGVSLTISSSKLNELSVAVIPYTYENTTFGKIAVGNIVNIEFDVLGKYMLELKNEQKMNKNDQK